jgi:signal peptidase I
MQPTLFAGNFVVVNKLAYQFGEPGRGDIIVFEYPPDPEQDPYIKRVIGLPGEHVRIADGKVTINGVQIQEPYLVSDTPQGGEWPVPEGSLFVMGDNRKNSSDSRSWGVVPIENVIGKAIVVYWPPEKWELLNMSYAVAAEP